VLSVSPPFNLDFTSDLFLGYVFEAYDSQNEQKVALKRTLKMGSIISREYQILNELKDSPNVV